MAKKRKKTHGPRKNPKRVAAGRKAAKARWGKKTTKKRGKKRTGASLERMIDKVLSKKFNVVVDGHRHSIGGSAPRKKSRGKKRGSGYLRSAENLQNLARGRAIRKAKLASRGGTMFGPIFDPSKVGKGGLYAQRLANLAKARAAKHARKLLRMAGA